MTRTLAVLLLTAAAVTLLAQQKAKVAAKGIDDAALKAAGKTDAASREWITYGGNYSETRYSPLKQIDAANVSRLGLAWSFKTESPQGGRIEATPIMYNGVLYATLAWDVVVAIDARTGKSKWRWDPEIPRQRIPQLCCGPVNRGVAIYKGRVYAGLLDGTVVALDQETGKVVWRVKDTFNEDTMLTAAIRIVKGKVIVGSAGAEQAVRGYFSAYDAATGKRLWRFYTVPGDPSKPFENPELAAAAKTWTGEWWKMGGGGTVWDGMAYDPEADLLYIGTGNGGPWNQNLRSPQGGDNLYIASILAVKPDTGKLVWYFQETPGDTWDFTSVQPMILADLTIQGKPRKVLMHAPKNGFFYVIDRITGQFIHGDKFVKRMTWATGLDAKGRPIEAKGARFTTNPVSVSPGPAGAANWQAMSFNPATKLAYLPGQEGSFVYSPLDSKEFTFKPGGLNTGVIGLNGPFNKMGGTGAASRLSPHEPEGAENQPKASGGFLVAWDPIANKERWRVNNLGGLGGGGTVTTAGNLVFHGSTAYNAETGAKVWEMNLGGTYCTPISYELDGKQYIAIVARSYPNDRLFVFALDAKEPLPEMSAR
ncbi:MAG: PQQ-dependent dehydrogenase, methanol/ethanol family [Acidobacteriota bacterium]